MSFTGWPVKLTGSEGDARSMPVLKPVVGAAIVRDGRVLAARRTAPSEAAGRWEFPGGKVESGETPETALEREIAEELGCTVEVTGWLGGTAPIGETHVLSVAIARLVRGEPTPDEHDQVRWLGPDELGDVDWLEPDRPFLPELAELLRTHPSRSTRAIFFDEESARAVAARLANDGYDAHVIREELAGEDDDEDHPWAVLTDAPAFVLELHADEFDGWLDAEPSLPLPLPAPVELPTAPRRVKRP